MVKQYYAYMMTNKWNTVLDIGVTNDLKRRIQEHRDKTIQGFTKRYRVAKLVYYEDTENIESAISREKQIKGGSRKDKVQLIAGLNPEWRDLFEEL